MGSFPSKPAKFCVDEFQGQSGLNNPRLLVTPVWNFLA